MFYYYVITIAVIISYIIYYFYNLSIKSRIDRLMTSGEKAIVVDFKTGEKSKADQKQVLEYMQILRKMNFRNVEGYLLYTRDKEVISVAEGKAKTMKKKDDAQLGLGFQ